jgi:hypothetical protein
MMFDVFPIGCFDSDEGKEAGAVLFATIGKDGINRLIKNCVARLVKEKYLVRDPVVLVFGSTPADCCQSLKEASMVGPSRRRTSRPPLRATPLATPHPLLVEPTLDLIGDGAGDAVDLSKLTVDELLEWADVHFLVHPYYLGRYAKLVCQSAFMVQMMDSLDAGTCVCVGLSGGGGGTSSERVHRVRA